MVVLLAAWGGTGAASLAPVRDQQPRRLPDGDTSPRTLIVVLPPLNCQGFLRAFPSSSLSGLMPVASQSDPDPNRTWATLAAGKGAVAGPRLGEVRPWGKEGVELDLTSIREANAAARTGAEFGMFGDLLHMYGLSTAVVAWNADLYDSAYRLALLGLADGGGRVDSGQAIAGPRYTPAVQDALEEAVLHHHVTLLAIGSSTDEQAPRGREWVAVVEAARSLLKDREALVLLLSPMAPTSEVPDVRSLGPVSLRDGPGRHGSGLLSSPSTRWPGIVTAADVAPTVLQWWEIWDLGNHGPEERAITAALCQKMQGRPIEVARSPETAGDVCALSRMLTDRYRLRVVVAKWYIGYGLLVVLLGFAVAFVRPGRLGFVAAPALALVLIPAGLAVAALVPPGRDAVHLAVTGAVAAALAFVGTRTRKPERGLAISLLLATALIAGDAMSGSWLMRRSAFEMGAMNGLRFYGISNDFMGCLVGMAVVGAAGLMQCCPRAGKVAAVIGVLVVLAIGAPFWGANWGGAVTAAAGFASLWLLTREHRRWPHVLLALGMMVAAALAPAAMDLAMSGPARSHIGAGLAALLSGRSGELGDMVIRKLLQNYGILRIAPWSGMAAALCVAVLWALLRRGGPGRLALADKRVVAAAIWASLIAGLVAMVVNDSGVAASFGCILAAVGAAVFAAARAKEVAV